MSWSGSNRSSMAASRPSSKVGFQILEQVREGRTTHHGDHRRPGRRTVGEGLGAWFWASSLVRRCDRPLLTRDPPCRSVMRGATRCVEVIQEHPLRLHVPARSCMRGACSSFESADRKGRRRRTGLRACGRSGRVAGVVQGPGRRRRTAGHRGPERHLHSTLDCDACQPDQSRFSQSSTAPVGRRQAS
jgi:hypothetical protein